MTHTVTIEDEGGDGPNQYRLTVSRELKKSKARNASINDHDSIHGTTAEGHANGGRDSYEYEGVRESIEVQYPDRTRIAVNDGPFVPASKYGEVSKLQVGSSSNESSGTSGNGGGSSTSLSSNDTPSIEERRQTADPDGEMNQRGTIVRTDENLRVFINGIDVPFAKEIGAVLDDGVYTPGALQRTLLSTRPEYEVDLIGNVEDPRTVQIRSNCNFNNLLKDEHFALRGLTMARTQLAGTGDPYVRDCSFTDRWGKSHSAIGGKPATGRFIDCEIGHAEDPDDYAMYYFGGGEVLLDRGNELVARKAYIGANNQVTLNIHQSTRFKSGPKEVVEGSGIKPDDLHDHRVTVIKNGKIIS